VREATPPKVLLLAVGMGTGGAETLLRDSIPLLVREGFDMTLYSLKEEGSTLEEIRRAGYRARSLGGAGHPRWSLLLRLWSEMRRERFDLVHSHLFWANVASRLAGRAAGVPVQISSHHGTDGWPSPAHRLLERRTARFADRVLVCSEAVRRYAADRVGVPEKKLVVIPNGVDAGRFASRDTRDRTRDRLRLAPDSPVIGSVGRLDEPVKGFSILIEAMARVAERFPRCVCLIAGDGPARSTLEASARARHPEGRIRFLGERRDIPEILSALDLYVQPSRQEGFGLSALEAMASGLALVASSTGGLPEVVRDGETGDLVPPGDAEALAGAVASLLQDSERRRFYGAAGALRARREFPLDRMVARWADLYRRLLSDRRLRKEAA
jgi:glycosyltransferase involved in cell wall biosynthesis